tara:strand:+ start:39931 stop:40110 length:180 start_codon:yes stop_codon:yes gene_type:complete
MNETIDRNKIISIAGILGTYLMSTFITAKMNVDKSMYFTPFETMLEVAIFPSKKLVTQT